ARLLKKDRKGRTKLYRILADNPVLKIYKVLNTLVVVEPLIERLGKICKRVILYGSCASGTNIEGSDLDLLVVCSKKDEVQDIISGFPRGAYYGFSDVMPVIKSPAEWAVIEQKDSIFYNELQKGVFLYEKEIDESRF
ncbi:MAG: nucleotidyltransferase domain-containing protein, partial [Deltaproteobacteria bacterium]|nr:nucleotidyltransferase domain-containing protein [Deltaproteobacteria bacterium]